MYRSDNRSGGPVQHWLGLGFFPPEGLHGPNRRRIVMRHTDGDKKGGILLGKALALAYRPYREVRLMRLLRQRNLNDALWRDIYALMIVGGRINRGRLVRFLQRLTDPDPGIADAEAIRTYKQWLFYAQKMYGDE